LEKKSGSEIIIGGRLLGAGITTSSPAIGARLRSQQDGLGQLEPAVQVCPLPPGRWVPVPVTMLTAMAPEVPAIDDVAVSVAVMVLLPNARSVAEKIKAARRLSQERAALRRRG